MAPFSEVTVHLDDGFGLQDERARQRKVRRDGGHHEVVLVRARIGPPALSE